MTEVEQKETASTERFWLLSGTKVPASVQKSFSALVVIDTARLKQEVKIVCDYRLQP
jgi:hypothetical protein